MSTTATQPPPGKHLKILMLHGYTQSGPLFRVKTRPLEKILQKALPLPVELVYPTAPNRLSPADIPDFVSSSEHHSDAWAWWRKEHASGEYLLLEAGMTSIADSIRQVGGIDGVCGFSQGAAAAGLVAAALEPRAVPEGRSAEWVHRLREANGGKALKFAVSYSGFWAPVLSLQFLYEPGIETPMLHFLGGLDTVVEEGRSRALIEKCVNATVVVHPGGHHVPVAKKWLMPLASFIWQHVQDSAAKD